MMKNAWTVSQLTKYIKNLIDNDWKLNEIIINGEISNFTHHSSGHMYFSVKDDKSVVRSIMFAGNNRALEFMPKNGMRVILKGNVTIYERDGQYQFYVQEMYPAGIGAIYVALQQLKERLAKEGLFAAEHKRSIPHSPKGIAVISSPTGAAIRDILITLKRRNKTIPVYVIPTTVQGSNAPDSIIEAISFVETYCTDLVDVIILARGGGAIEELSAFNDERVARKIFHCLLPIVVGVGHETDTTIADYVADMRAPTPTGAAELVSPMWSDMQKEFDMLIGRLNQSMHNILKKNRERLTRCSEARVLRQPEVLIIQQKQQVDQVTKILQQTFHFNYKQAVNKFMSVCQRLEDLSPVKIMARGYSLTYKEHNTHTDIEKRIITSISQVQKNDNIQVQLTDGVLHCTIRGIIGDKKS